MRFNKKIVNSIIGANFFILSSVAYGQTNTPWTTNGPIGVGTTTTGNAPFTINYDALNQLRIENDGLGKESSIRFRSRSSNGYYLHADISVISTGTDQGFLGFKVPHGNSEGAGYKMVIDHNGSIGMGTTTPFAKLHINSNIPRETLRLYYSGNTTNYLSMWQGTGGGAIDPIGTGLLYLGYDQATTVVIGKSGGELAIGTTTPSPGYKLTVRGAIHAEEVKVDLNVEGPDYVFESDYPLASLEDTKTYIEQNKHLPGIPSSDEMQQNGVNLLEMNMKLLEKVEELTLHLISINAENAELKARVSTLENNQPTQSKTRK